ncbi:Dihydrofolate reductase (EC 1.5.1.3) [Methylomonas albis]|uniref:Dihydrofolate reductase n=1 Tax=Methylomonas albis TaxID=1854563 RepID=A0ABR9D645_9GAMM|nr:dihydrofolate reductase [Methylomonas albis]MBD9358592.1 dihydrofolate reductase [Methylomonas albis]CAD6882015.1 Dihydrofolate reductase (EC 1.5.1.3) [Methylomonas albis]
MKISLIVALASNRAIGLNGQMPWHLSADLKRFKQITMGAPILMGRKTFEAIGRPLPGRENIIISRDPSYQQPGCRVFGDIDSVLQRYADSRELFVIGGATLYEAMLRYADYLYLTEINKSFAGDTFFPEIDPRQWREVSRDDVENDQAVDFTYSFLKLENVHAGSSTS